MFKDKEWKDGYTSLEDQLPKIVAFFEVGADDEIAREIRWEKSRQEQQQLKDKSRPEFSGSMTRRIFYLRMLANGRISLS